MFDEYNPLAQAFRVARNRFESNNQEAVKLRLIGGRETDGRTYNLPTASEVAALIIGDVGSSVGESDIIVETKSGQLQRLNELHPSYLPLQYPLLFPYGEDGYRLGIQLRDSTSINRKRKKLTMREFFAFRIHEREDEVFTILWSRKLFQQLCVDGFTMIESERMCYIRTHQKQLRVDKYKNLKEVPRQNTNSSSTGKPMILPSSFTGCARYNAETYKDAMAICKWYISPCEAVWRILGYDIHYRTPSVERLSFHLPDEQSIVFEDDEPLEDVMNKSGINSSIFLKWIDCNKKSHKARNLTYCEFPTEFVWHKKGRKEWRERDQRYSIGRIYYVSPGSGELYYLSSLLNIVKGPTCYEDIRTVNGVLYSAFKEACYALGLLEDDKEYIDGSMSRPEFVYEQIWKFLADDVLFRQRSILQITDLMLSEEQLKDHTLALIENLLQSNGRSLSQFPPMPLPDHDLVSHGLNKLIQGELCYDRTSMDLEHKRLSSCLTDEQKGVYDEIMNALAGDEGGVFFLYGYGGTGKTFMWKTLSAAIRSQG
uniref:ATP-dependent DNA helicase n=1 Tax=Chenopodium quinoa TaxID=63459 RepID=A0A803MTD1_CHEQI